ncbi:hypothetical protein V1520DRAFT_367453 [Lipomyces starkeyi]|uniref:Uncharacterized protein n=1 Tax=Lipomyces starkeyi NRRL Y-11557 TaxID=675824 RepID=A0A1E3QDH3_LIPST|nr:hypothetical protein LIPSTDRAFT_1182 [Lipomyces starkeyi NRRL Y-11557]
MPSALAQPNYSVDVEKDMSVSPVVVTPPPVTTMSISSENISSGSRVTVTHSLSSAQDQNSATESPPQSAPILSRFRPLAPAPPGGAPQIAPYLRMSSSSTAQAIPWFSTPFSSTSSRAAEPNASRTGSSPWGQTGDEEDWEDLPATAIREMDQTTAQHQLFRANAAIRRLRSSLSNARTASSRHRFESRVLKFETEESLKRYQVENFIVKRQVDILRVDLLRPRPSDQRLSESEMAARVGADKYRRRLIRAKSRLYETQKMIEDREMEIDRLKQRIRESRLHRDSTRSGFARDGQNHDSKHRAGNNDGEGALAALGILASQVLSQHQVENLNAQSRNLTHRQRTAHPEKQVGSKTVASAISTTQRKQVTAQESMTPQIAESDTDVADTDVEHMDTEPEDQFEDAEEALTPTTIHTRRATTDAGEDASNFNKAATDPKVDNGEHINAGHLEGESLMFNRSETTDNFDPDETIEVQLSPVVLFQTINDSPSNSPNTRKSPRRQNVNTEDNDETPLTPRNKTKRRRHSSSASNAS